MLADHADDIVMFDVPPPDARRPRHRRLPRHLAAVLRVAGRRAPSFEIESLDVTAGTDVAFAYALLRCGTPEEFAENPDKRLRLTIGLRKEDGRWVVDPRAPLVPRRPGPVRHRDVKMLGHLRLPR